MGKQLICLGLLVGLGILCAGCQANRQTAASTGKAPATGTAPATANGKAKASANAVSISPVPADSFKRQWTAKLDMRNDAPAAAYLRGEMLFVYSQRNTVYALNAHSGEILFLDQVAPRGVKVRPPVMLGTRVAIPTNTTLQVYNLQGRKQSSIELGVPIRSDAVGQGSVLFMGVDYPRAGRLAQYSVDRVDAPLNWELVTFGAVAGTPALHENVVYAATLDGRTYAVSTDRKAVWPLDGNVFLTAGPVEGDVGADDFGVYIASADSKLYCLDRATGKVKWQYFAGQALRQGPVVTAGIIYQLVPGTGLVAINKTEGKYNREAMWVLPRGKQVLAQDDSYVYIARQDNRIVAVDKQTGKVRFQSKRTDFNVFATNLGGSTIYAARGDEAVAITPVLSGGSVGEMVLLERPVKAESLAAAR